MSIRRRKNRALKKAEKDLKKSEQLFQFHLVRIRARLVLLGKFEDVVHKRLQVIAKENKEERDKRIKEHLANRLDEIAKDS